MIQDAVVYGHDRQAIGLLAWINPEVACRTLGPSAPAAEIIEQLRRGLAAHNAAHPASSTRIQRLLVLAEPPSIDAGEITDKGQAAVLDRRADLVSQLYAEAPGSGIIEIAPSEETAGASRSGDRILAS